MTHTVISKSEYQVKFNNLSQIKNLVKELIDIHSTEEFYSSDLNLEHGILIYFLYNNLSGNKGVIPKKWFNIINSIREKNSKLKNKILLEKLGDLILRDISPLISEEIIKNVENVESFIDHLGEIEGINQDWWSYLISSWSLKFGISNEELIKLILRNELSWDEFRKHILEEDSIILNPYNVSKCNKLLNLLRIIFSYTRGTLPLDEQGENYLVEIRADHDVVQRLELSVLHKLNRKPAICYVNKNYMEALVQEVTKEWIRIKNAFISSRYLAFLKRVNLEYLLNIENYNNSSVIPDSSKNATDAQKVAWLIEASQNFTSLTAEESLNKSKENQVLPKPTKTVRLCEIKNEFITLVKKQRQEVDQSIVQDWNLIVTDCIKEVGEELKASLISQASIGNLREEIVEIFNAYKSENNFSKVGNIHNIKVWDASDIISRGKYLIIKFILLLVFNLFFSIFLEWGLFKILQSNYLKIVEEWVKRNKLSRNRNIILFGILMLLLLGELAFISKYFKKTRNVKS